MSRTGALSVVLPGDYNLNGVVDAADYVVWRQTLGQRGVGLAADGNNNNGVDSGDFDICARTLRSACRRRRCPSECSRA